MNLRARVYVGVVVAAGAVLVGFAVTQPIEWSVVIPVLVLVFLAEATPVLLRRSGRNQTLSMTVLFPIRLAVIVLAGPWAVILTTLPTLIAYVRGGRPVVKRVFNAAQLSIAVWLAGMVYVALGGDIGPMGGDTFLSSLAPFVVAALVYYLVNTFLVSVVITLTGPVGYREFWRQAMRPLTTTYLGYGPVGVLLAILWDEIGPFSLVIALGPIVIAHWASTQSVAQRDVQDSALRTFARAVETKDFYTRGHSERVSKLVGLMGCAIDMPEERVALLSYAGLLHDIGKIRVPTHILQKAGPLTRDEFAAIQLHPVYGQAMMRDVSFLDDVLPGILHHHERFDGGGYPMGLAGADIPEFARIIAAADALDSMTSTRSYRSATTVEDALAEIRRGAGTQFDPQMVELLDAVVAEHGWQAYEAPAVPEVDDVVASTFDHDDPRRPLPDADDPREPDVS